MRAKVFTDRDRGLLERWLEHGAEKDEKMNWGVVGGNELSSTSRRD